MTQHTAIAKPENLHQWNAHVFIHFSWICHLKLIAVDACACIECICKAAASQTAPSCLHKLSVLIVTVNCAFIAAAWHRTIYINLIQTRFSIDAQRLQKSAEEASSSASIHRVSENFQFHSSKVDCTEAPTAPTLEQSIFKFHLLINPIRNKFLHDNSEKL